MKTKIKKNEIIRKVLLAVFLAFAVALMGCENSDPVSPMQAPESLSTQNSPATQQSLLKGRQSSRRPGQQYPIIASKVFKFLPGSNFYKGGTLMIGRGTGSNFHVNDGALVPPDSIPWGSDVTITMQVDYDEENGELLFTFGPHGSTFLTPARIRLHYNQLGVDKADLYYIDDDGNYIPQVPDDINFKKHFMDIYVHHFSRYALARSHR